jgi:hypothetical protein
MARKRSASTSRSKVAGQGVDDVELNRVEFRSYIHQQRRPGGEMGRLKIDYRMD